MRDAKKVEAVKNGRICCVVAFVADFFAFPAFSARASLETIRERLFVFSFWFDSLPPPVLLPSCLSVFAKCRALGALSFVLLSHDLFAFYHKFCLLFLAAVALHLCAVPPPPPSPPTTSNVWSIYRLETALFAIVWKCEFAKVWCFVTATTASRMRHEPKMATFREREHIKLRWEKCEDCDVLVQFAVTAGDTTHAAISYILFVHYVNITMMILREVIVIIYNRVGVVRARHICVRQQCTSSCRVILAIHIHLFGNLRNCCASSNKLCRTDFIDVFSCKSMCTQFLNLVLTVAARIHFVSN